MRRDYCSVLIILILLSTVPASAQDDETGIYYVRPGNFGCKDGSREYPYGTLSEALQAGSGEVCEGRILELYIWNNETSQYDYYGTYEGKKPMPEMGAGRGEVSSITLASPTSSSFYTVPYSVSIESFAYVTVPLSVRVSFAGEDKDLRDAPEVHYYANDMHIGVGSTSPNFPSAWDLSLAVESIEKTETRNFTLTAETYDPFKQEKLKSPPVHIGVTWKYTRGDRVLMWMQINWWVLLVAGIFLAALAMRLFQFLQGQHKVKHKRTKEAEARGVLSLAKLGDRIASELRGRQALAHQKDEMEKGLKVGPARHGETEKRTEAGATSNDTARGNADFERIRALIERKRRLIFDWQEAKIALEEAYNRGEVNRAAYQLKTRELDDRISDTIAEIEADSKKLDGHAAAAEVNQSTD